MDSKTFLSLKKQIANFSPYLLPEEMQELEGIVADYETRYHKFVDNVLNHDQFDELSGGRKRSLETPKDWADAFSELKRLLDVPEQQLSLKLATLFDEEHIKLRTAACGRRKKGDCARPCDKAATSCKYTAPYVAPPRVFKIPDVELKFDK